MKTVGTIFAILAAVVMLTGCYSKSCEQAPYKGQQQMSR
jgi:outer membrane murein-binding lipoprotein Lpp